MGRAAAEVVAQSRGTFTRVQEIIAFARSFGAKKIGLAACMLPGVAFSSSLRKSGPAKKAKAATGSALERIKAQIEQWKQDGQQFKADQLAADNDAQWDRLLKHYFDRDGFASISVNAANLCPCLKPVNGMAALVREMLDKDISFPMISVLTDTKNVSESFFHGRADAYLPKPFTREMVLHELAKLGLADVGTDVS